MVTVKLMGGLGNQMFQYACGRSLSIDLGEELYLDISFYNRIHKNATPRHYELDHLNVKGNVVKRGFLSRYWLYLIELLAKKFPLFFPKYIHERGTSCNLIATGKGKKNLYLDGYWQSEKYFQHHEDIIRREFQVITPQSDENKKWAMLISSTSSVCLHVRRGDYVTDSDASKVHGTRGQDYYHKAIEYISNIVENPVFFIFSDDFAWTKANISLSYEVHYMDQNGPDEDYEDLRLMMLCKHFIIANSSFSWWGAWLGKYGGKVIVCPKNWFNDPKMKTDIICDSWTKL